LKILAPSKLFFFSLFLLLVVNQSLKAQYAVTEMARYIGGNQVETPRGIKNIGGFTYIIAETRSSDMPVTNGSTFKGLDDIYIAKLNSSGSILFASYFGGSGSESISAKNSFEVVGDDIYFICRTYSTDLPVTNSTVFGSGAGDVAVVKMNSISGAIGFCTYYGGNALEKDADIKVGNGNIYLACITQSNNLSVTNGSSYKGAQDLAIAKLNGNNGSIIWSTYFGGNNQDNITNIEVDANTVYVAGHTKSSLASLPSTDGSIIHGDHDLFYAKLNTNTGNTDFLTYYGTNSTEYLKQLKVVSGEAYLLGYTYGSDFPTTNGTLYSGNLDATLVKYNSNGTLAYATIFGSTGNDIPVSMEIQSGNVYCLINAGAANFPVTNGSNFSGSSTPMAVTKLSNTGTLLFSALIGGVSTNTASDIKVDCNDNVFILASIFSSGYPVTNGSSYSSPGYNNVLSKINCTSGKLLFSSYITSSNSSSFPSITLLGSGVVEILSGILGNTQPVTLPGNGANSNTDLVLMRLNTCPTGFTGSTAVNPAIQYICSNGIAGLINMAPAVLPGSAQPLQYINGVPTVPADIPVYHYQWQIAAAPGGPWSDIPGAFTQNLTPSNQTADRYYRRLSQSICCGITTTEQIGDVAAILISNTAPTVNAGGPFNTCAGTPVIIGGSPTATAAPGNSITNYLWTPIGGYTPGNNVANPSVSPTVSTIYNVLVTDNFGCQQIGQALVNVYAADAGPDKSSCSGNTVRIGTAPIVGVPGVIYSWTASPADPTMSCTNCAQPDVHPTVTTTYTLTLTLPVSGGGTCTTTDAVVVSVVTAPTNNGGAFGGPDVTVCYSGSDIIGTPAEPGFTYTWAPGNYLLGNNTAQTIFESGSLDFPNPNPFNYFITAQKNGCIFVDSVKAFVIKADAGTDGCGPILIGTPDGTPNINETYSWTKITTGAGTSNFLAGTSSAQVPVSGCTEPTTFRLTVTFNGTTCTDDVVISQCGCPNPTITVKAPFDCASYSVNGGNVALIATTSIPANLTWSPAAGLSATTGDTVYLTDNVPRTYTVTATNINDPSVSCTNTISVNNPSFIKPSFTAQHVTVCPSTPVNIGQPPVAGYSYEWSQAYGLNSTTISNPVATVTSNTNYQVIVTDVGSGCTVKDTAKVLVYNLPSNVAGNNITLCGSGIAQLGVNSVPGITYLWTPAAAYNPSNLSANPTVPVATTTTFHVVATNTAGGCTISGDITVTVNSPLAPFSFTNQSFCPSTAGAIPLPAGPSGMSIYSWSPATSVLNPNSNGPTATTLNPRPSNSSTYTLTVYDAAGCSRKASVTFTPTVSVPDAGSDKIICLSNGPVMLGNASAPTGGGIIYSWSPAAGLSSTSIPNPMFTPSVAGTFTFIITKTEGGCSTTDRVTVTVQDYKIPAMSSQTICQNSCSQIGTIPVAGVTYIWSPSAGLSNANIANPVACPTASTTYSLTAVGTNGCVDKKDIIVHVGTDPSPTVYIPPVFSCFGWPSNERFSPIISPAGTYSFLWSPNDGYLSNIYVQSPYLYSTSVGTKTYNLKVINQATGCGTISPGEFTIFTCNVVAVNLIQFNAKAQEKNVSLNWTVSNEDDQAVYEVQFSPDASNFTTIGKVTANGSSIYSLLHTSPVIGINYYRLKMIAKDGSFTYSNISKVILSRQTGSLTIYPNPASEAIKIIMPEPVINKSVRIIIYGADGSQVLVQDVRSANAKETIDIRFLPAGIYTVFVKGNFEHYNSRFIILK